MEQQQVDRQALAAEVLEMGEQLFELALAGRGDTQGGITGFERQEKNSENERETYPIEEIRAASGEFFTALRLLLDVEGEQG